jgi:hypothetical protein
VLEPSLDPPLLSPASVPSLALDVGASVVAGSSVTPDVEGDDVEASVVLVPAGTESSSAVQEAVEMANARME